MVPILAEMLRVGFESDVTLCGATGSQKAEIMVGNRFMYRIQNCVVGDTVSGGTVGLDSYLQVELPGFWHE